MKTPQVLVVSFMMKSHARLIQGYFDDDELKIQFTEAHNFDVGEPGYTTTMNNFLKWAGAVPQGNTRLLERYPIDELINPKTGGRKDALFSRNEAFFWRSSNTTQLEARKCSPVITTHIVLSLWYIWPRQKSW